MRRGDGKGEGGGCGVGGSEGGGHGGGGEGGESSGAVRRAVAVRRSKDSNGGDLWVMLEECSVCFGKRKEEHGRL